MHIRPHDNSIRFNVALAQQECAALIVRKGESERTVGQLRHAAQLVSSAEAMFKYLRDTPPFPKGSYEPAMAGERARYCETTLGRTVAEHIVKQELADVQRAELVAQLEAAERQRSEAKRQAEVRFFVFLSSFS